MRVTVATVLWMDKNQRLPLYIRNAWRVYKAEDPARAAEAAIAYQFWRFLIGSSAGLIAVALFAAFTIGTWMDMSRTSVDIFISKQWALWATAILIAFFIAAAVALVAYYKENSIRQYARKQDAFGFEFGRLLTLMSTQEITFFSDMKKEEAFEKVTAVLVQSAAEVLDAERSVEEHRKDRFKEGWVPSYADERARDHFRYAFELAKRFDLANPAGWGPYFDAAKAKLEKPEAAV